MTTSRWWVYAVCHLMPFVSKGKSLSVTLFYSAVLVLPLCSVELIILYCKSLIWISWILLQGRLLAEFSWGQSHSRCSGSLAICFCVFFDLYGAGIPKSFYTVLYIAIWISPVGTIVLFHKCSFRRYIIYWESAGNCCISLLVQKKVSPCLRRGNSKNKFPISLSQVLKLILLEQMYW